MEREKLSQENILLNKELKRAKIDEKLIEVKN